MAEEDALNQLAENLQPRSVEVAKVSIKIPPFWHAKPELWIAQVES